MTAKSEMSAGVGIMENIRRRERERDGKGGKRERDHSAVFV